MASRLKGLRNRAVALHQAMSEATAAIAELAGSDLNEEEAKKQREKLVAEYDRHKAELVDVNADLKREIELQEIERGFQPVADDNQLTDDAQSALDGKRQQEAQKGWNSFGEYLVAVVNAASGNPNRRIDPRLLQPSEAITGLGEAVPADGGFLVGVDYSTELMKRTYENNQVLSGQGFASPKRIPISARSNGTRIPGIDETSRADGSRWGGIRSYWEGEADEKTASKPKFRRIELDLKKLIGLCYATDEMLQDAPVLETVIMEGFSEEFAFKIQDALFNGSGAGQALGILNAPCLVPVAKEAGQLATPGLVKENIDKMWSRMWARGIPTSVWHINQDCYPALFQLHQAVGTGGVPVYLPPGGLSASPYGTLLGRPVVPVEQCQTLGTKGDIYFCDWSQYLFADKGAMQSASSIHLRFNFDETVFRFVFRCDGQPAWNSALTPFKGTATTGPFVALNVRA